MTRSVVVPALLCLLAVLDGAFAGFRASAGRDARLPDRQRNAVAAAWGVGVATAGLAVIGLACLWVLRDDRSFTYDALVAGGVRMLPVYVPMAVVTLVAIGLHVFVSDHEVSAAAMTVVLGPITLTRPVIIALGGALAASSDTDVTALPAIVAVAVTTLSGPLIGVMRYRGR